MRKAIKKRVVLAFDEVNFDSQNSEQLQKVLNVCEQCVTELKYVAYRVKPCFPPEFHVMSIYVQNYEECVMQRMDRIMDNMAEIVRTEPHAVLIFNKFVAICKDADFYTNVWGAGDSVNASWERENIHAIGPED